MCVCVHLYVHVYVCVCVCVCGREGEGGDEKVTTAYSSPSKELLPTALHVEGSSAIAGLGEGYFGVQDARSIEAICPLVAIVTARREAQQTTACSHSNKQRMRPASNPGLRLG